MKRIVGLCAAVFAVLVLAGCRQDNDMYALFISELKAERDDALSYVCDIDGDGSDELVVLDGTAVEVYGYDEDAVLLGSHDFFTGSLRLFRSDKASFPGIFWFTVDGGLNHYGYMTVSSGKLVTEELWTEDYSGVSGEQGKVTEISTDKAKIKESKRLYEAEKDIEFE